MRFCQDQKTERNGKYKPSTLTTKKKTNHLLYGHGSLVILSYMSTQSLFVDHENYSKKLGTN